MSNLPEHTARLLSMAEAGSDVTDADLSECASRLATATIAVERLREIAANLEMELSARMERDIMPLPHGGVLMRGYTRRSQWRDEHSSADLRRDLGEAVAKHVALDNATGDIDAMKRNVARATVEAMWELVPSFSSIKAAGRKYGLDIENYRTFSDVSVVSVQSEEYR